MSDTDSDDLDDLASALALLGGSAEIIALLLFVVSVPASFVLFLLGGVLTLSGAGCRIVTWRRGRSARRRR